MEENNKKENNVIGKIMEHPDVSFQMIITQKISGEIELCFIDHISKTVVQALESEFAKDNNFIPTCKNLIEKSKISHRNVTLF